MSNRLHKLLLSCFFEIKQVDGGRVSTKPEKNTKRIS
ncbi:hypothetical protein CTO_0955 [Chlamydia trachomatis A2497]|uniref:Uncharacterized protein n=1 Tax=Chlamydia trachomatis serovar A (strain A2497) TaxID=580047 RepID=G4NNE2_CHLT4|nr:hypothetical protein CTO_0955 [Chlamydia trachomatis A2497]